MKLEILQCPIFTPLVILLVGVKNGTSGVSGFYSKSLVKNRTSLKEIFLISKSYWPKIFSVS